MIVRGMIVLVVCVALAACSPEAKKAAAEADSSCVQSASREIAILGDAPDYIVEARSFEAPMPLAADRAEMAKSNPCASATVVLTFRRKDDAAFVHGYATSMNRMDLIEGHAGPAFDGVRLKAFLEGWTSAIVSSTDLASAKSETVTTHLDVAGYAAMKAAKKPMICHETSVHETACFVVAPDNIYVFEPFYSEDHS
jgi:hypothetical protein